MSDVIPLGDRAFLARFATEAEARAWTQAVRRRDWLWMTDWTLAYQSAAIFFDPDRVEPQEAWDLLRGIQPDPKSGNEGRSLTIPVLYDGEDLDGVAQRLGLSLEKTIALHSGTDYEVFAIGFLPGFPYAGYLPESLAGLPRLASPRSQVPAGSVAIAGRQTAIYPQASPGGWRLLGRTPLKIVDMEAGRFPIQVGDRLRFTPIDPEEYHRRSGEFLE